MGNFVWISNFEFLYRWHMSNDLWTHVFFLLSVVTIREFIRLSFCLSTLHAALCRFHNLKLCNNLLQPYMILCKLMCSSEIAIFAYVEEC